MAVLAIDVGTTGCKALIFDERGSVRAAAYREYPLIHPRPGWAELDPTVVWERVRESVREVARMAGDEVRALSVSAQGEAVIPVDRRGNVLDNSIVTFDSRAAEMVEVLEENVGRDRIFKITGIPLSGMYTACKLLWLRENKREVFRDAWKFLCYEDYIHYKLGLQPVIDFSLAGKTMMFDVITKRWSTELMDIVGIDESKLAEPHLSGEIIGRISKSAADELSLRSDVVAVVGAHDQAAGALGAGVTGPDIGMDATGTTESIALVSPVPILKDDMCRYNYPCYPYVLEDTYITVAFNLVAGALLKWYRDTFGREEIEEARAAGRDVYDVILEKASSRSSGPSDIYVLPHFAFSGTPYCDPSSKGAIVGLTLSTTKAEIIKAIIEGVTFEMKLNLKYLSGLGFQVKELRATGGGSRSRTWLQLKADMFRTKVVSLEVSDSPCLGAAILAATALGEYESVAQAAGVMVKPGEVFTPDQNLAALYDERMPVFERIYPSVKAIFRSK
ncbi:MAG: hypothetical protein HPY71_11670 [Firmicutes bacterium]|nr:hypothetical protein [Bacillota bacterium]